MSTFTYKAIDQRGSQATGKTDGESKAAVAATLRNQGFTVLDLNEVKRGIGQIQIGCGIKAKDLTVFSRQFATMVNSGLSMLRCLYVLEEQTPNKKFAKVISEIRADVARISLMTLANFLLGVCSSRTYRQRSIERPELTMVANCREKTVRSLALMPPPIWIWPQPFLTSLRSRTVKPWLRRD